jgi:hypothetical protein
MRQASDVLDHLVLATPDVGATGRWVEQATGVTASPGGRHIGRGTRNVLYSLGPASYLEIIGPDPEQASPPDPRPFGIDGLTGPALVAWAIAVDDIEAAVERARGAGFDPGPYEGMQRRRPDGVLLSWRLTTPASVVIPFLIDWGASPHPAADAVPGLILAQLAARHPDPGGVSRNLGALGVTMTIEPGSEALLATLRGPRGSIVFPETARAGSPRP